MKNLLLLAALALISVPAQAQFVPPTCGDGICNGPGNGSTENHLSCPQDCPSRCGDGCCEPCEVSASVPGCAGCSVDCVGFPGPHDSCGDGCPGTQETCDWGDDNSDFNANQCRTNCELPFCGDTRTDDGAPFNEECDDGEDNGTGPDECRPNCVLPFCGDGIIDPFEGEECDDGNDNPDDACNNACLFPGCGNGVLDAGEFCDHGGSGVDCLMTCQSFNDCCVPNTCGDGIVGAGEACDDANNLDGDTCRYDCGQDFTDCGDGVLDPGEACDEDTANADTPDALCRTDCTLPRCGDGVIDTGESCDGTAGCAPECE